MSKTGQVGRRGLIETPFPASRMFPHELAKFTGRPKAGDELAPAELTQAVDAEFAPGVDRPWAGLEDFPFEHDDAHRPYLVKNL